MQSQEALREAGCVPHTSAAAAGDVRTGLQCSGADVSAGTARAALSSTETSINKCFPAAQVHTNQQPPPSGWRSAAAGFMSAVLRERGCSKSIAENCGPTPQTLEITAGIVSWNDNTATRLGFYWQGLYKNCTFPCFLVSLLVVFFPCFWQVQHLDMLF